MFLFLEGVLLNEKARVTLDPVRVANLKALPSVPKLVSRRSMPIS